MLSCSMETLESCILRTEQDHHFISVAFLMHNFLPPSIIALPKAWPLFFIVVQHYWMGIGKMLDYKNIELCWEFCFVLARLDRDCVSRGFCWWAIFILYSIFCCLVVLYVESWWSLHLIQVALTQPSQSLSWFPYHEVTRTITTFPLVTRSRPIILSGFSGHSPVAIWTTGWKETLWEWSVLPKNTTLLCGHI